MHNEPTIIFENKNIIALYKPAGYLSHPVKKGDLRPSITAWLAKKYPSLQEVGKSENRFAIVHRLDRETSGVILAAKNQETFESLQKQFKQRFVKKEYIALIEGKIEKSGVIDAPLIFVKNKRGFKIKSVSIGADTLAGGPMVAGAINKKIRQARTEFTVLRSHNNYTLLTIFPQTGRTHQIRAHLKSIGHPIVGDKRYNKKSSASSLRMFLHASALEFSYPEGKKLRIEASLPNEFYSFLKR